MKTIKMKILLSIIFIVLVSVVITGGISSYLNYSSTLDSLEQTLTEAVVIASNQTAAELKAYVNLVKQFAYNNVVLSDTSLENRITQLNNFERDEGFAVVQLISVNGIDLETGMDVSKQPGFQEVKTNLQPFISDPTMNDAVGDMLIYFTVPILQDGKFNGVVVGGMSAKVLAQIVSNIQVGTGNAAILNNKGDTIGFSDYDLVLQQYNTQEEAKTDSRLVRLAEIEYAMTQGISDFRDYYYDGVEKFMAFCPVPGTNGWSIDIAVVRDEFMGGTVNAVYITVAIMVVTLLCASIVAIRLSNSIAKPIKATARRLELLAEGDLTTDVIQVKGRDETAVLAGSLERTVDDLRVIIHDITEHLGAMSDGDFTAQIDMEYKGGFQPIKDAIINIAQSLNQTLSQIDVAAEQVSSGSDQVSAGAQALSQGATEQASSVQELAATITEISEQVKDNAENARLASERVEYVSGEMTISNEKMDQMIQAMDEISAKSTEIGKIIKTIEDIAFQTNILALNAAVEAARAGSAGKGFAVVADEVRNLANKSQEASKNTSALIEGSLTAVQNGTHIVSETAQSLRVAVEGASEVTATITKISDASSEQANAITQVTQGVEQISAVVQTNSATAEQSAAASEELSSQAALMKNLLSSFRLKEYENV